MQIKFALKWNVYLSCFTLRRWNLCSLCVNWFKVLALMCLKWSGCMFIGNFTSQSMQIVIPGVHNDPLSKTNNSLIPRLAGCLSFPFELKAWTSKIRNAGTLWYYCSFWNSPIPVAYLIGSGMRNVLVHVAQDDKPGRICTVDNKFANPHVALVWSDIK